MCVEQGQVLHDVTGGDKKNTSNCHQPIMVQLPFQVANGKEGLWQQLFTEHFECALSRSDCGQGISMRSQKKLQFLMIFESSLRTLEAQNKLKRELRKYLNISRHFSRSVDTIFRLFLSCYPLKPIFYYGASSEWPFG
jgi:hypothetical protein